MWRSLTHFTDDLSARHLFVTDYFSRSAIYQYFSFNFVGGFCWLLELSYVFFSFFFKICKYFSCFLLTMTIFSFLGKIAVSPLFVSPTPSCPPAKVIEPQQADVMHWSSEARKMAEATARDASMMINDTVAGSAKATPLPPKVSSQGGRVRRVLCG